MPFSTLEHCVDATSDWNVPIFSILVWVSLQLHSIGGSMNATCISSHSTRWDCRRLQEWIQRLTVIVQVSHNPLPRWSSAWLVLDTPALPCTMVALCIDKWWGGQRPTRHNEECTIWEDCEYCTIGILHNQRGTMLKSESGAQGIMRMHNGPEVDNVSTVPGSTALGRSNDT